MNFTKGQWNHGLKSGIEMYSTHNKGKSVIAEKFIRTLQKIINTLLKF